MKTKILIILIILIGLGVGITESSAINPESPKKGQALLTLYDENGDSWTNATVKYTQTAHDFLFGVSMTSPRGRVPPRIYSDLKTVGVNYALPFVSWVNVEPEKGKYTWDTIDYMYRPAEMHQLGYTLNGHCMIWFYDASWNLPSYVSSMNFDELKQAIYKHVYDSVTHYKGLITYWTINEPLFYSMAIQLSEEQWVEVIRTTTQAVHAADPNSKVMVNLPPVEQTTINYYPHQLLETLASQEVAYDIIGLEIYADPRIGNQVDEIAYTDIQWASSVLDSYARFGKPVMVSETCVPDKPTLEAQAEWLRKFYAMAFEKPFVVGITWYFIDDDHTQDVPAFFGCGLFPDFDSEPRPIYQALADVIQERTTEGTAKTDADGRVRIVGYAGDYLIEADDGIRKASFSIHINEGKEDHISLSASASIIEPKEEIEEELEEIVKLTEETEKEVEGVPKNIFQKIWEAIISFFKRIFRI